LKEPEDRAGAPPEGPPRPEGTAARALLAAFLAWVLPGLGHLFLGSRAKAVAFFLVVAGFSALGLATHGKLYRPDPEKPLTYLASFADLGLGPGYLGALAARTALGEPRAVTHEHGNAFLLTAGIMNILLILDAWDIARGRKA
jgi:hypothetical protein